ncbi:Homocysteine S-methyltransferase family protein [Trifolium repens]|nr:Homocysteine S-methyltransferase family protein [Trifolium repens]
MYGPDVNLNKLKDFHRRRLQVLVEAGPDLLAFETIPNKLEARAIVELLEEINVEIPSWICFTSVDGENAPSGERFRDCLEVINKCNKVEAFETCNSLDELFHVNGIPHLALLDETGKVVTEDGVDIIRDYGAEGYPFTSERVKELKDQEEEAKRNQSLKSPLVYILCL